MGLAASPIIAFEREREGQSQPLPLFSLIILLAYSNAAK